MILRRPLIPLLGIAVLTGVYLLGHLFAGFQSQDLSPNRALLSDIAASPLSWGYALTSAMVFIAFLAWAPTQLPVWRLLVTFRKLDSTSLNNHAELCQRFYRALLEFRCRHGEQRFMQQLVSRLNLFDGYHNDAIDWINDIVRQVDTAVLPANMIIDSICSGHIGRVYSGCYYGGGLPSAFVRIDEAIYLLARMTSVEVWSASSRAPICVFVRHDLQLEPKQYHTHYASVTLSGRQTPSLKTRQLELRIPKQSATAQQGERPSAQESIEALQSWLAVLMFSANQVQPETIATNVTDISCLQKTVSSQAIQTPLHDLLQQMLGSHIDAAFNQVTLSDADPDLAPATVVLCSGLGVITIMDVPLAGIIHYSGEPYWMHIDIGSSQRFGNACLAAQRAKTALSHRLADAGLNRWPVHSLVVFSHGDAQPELELGRQQVQCDVTTLEQLPKWFASQPADDSIRFNKNDYNEFISLLDPARLHRAQIKHA